MDLESDFLEFERLLTRLLGWLGGGKRKLAEVWSAGAMQNGRRYERYVQSDRYQANIHAGRWHTDQQVADEEEGAVAQLVAQAIEAVIEATGGENSPIKKIAILLKARMQVQAPPPAGSTYSRTGILKASYRSRSYTR